MQHSIGKLDGKFSVMALAVSSKSCWVATPNKMGWYSLRSEPHTADTYMTLSVLDVEATSVNLLVSAHFPPQPESDLLFPV